MASIAFVGFVTIDLIEGQPYLGGAAGVMSLNAQYLGHASTLVSMLSNNTYGALYKRHLKEAGVDTSLSVTDASAMPTCVITDPHGFGSTRQWSDNGACRRIADIRLQPADLVGVDAIFLCNAPPLLVKKILTAYDGPNLFYIPGPSIVSRPERVLEEALDRSRIVFANEEEAVEVLKKDPFGHKVEMLVLTRGQAGGEVRTADGTTIEFEAPAVGKVLDTTGAGDAFSLGFGSAILDGKPVEHALESAKSLAGKVLEKRGGLVYKE